MVVGGVRSELGLGVPAKQSGSGLRDVHGALSTIVTDELKGAGARFLETVHTEADMDVGQRGVTNMGMNI